MRDEKMNDKTNEKRNKISNLSKYKSKKKLDKILGKCQSILIEMEDKKLSKRVKAFKKFKEMQAQIKHKDNIRKLREERLASISQDLLP